MKASTLSSAWGSLVCSWCKNRIEVLKLNIVCKQEKIIIHFPSPISNYTELANKSCHVSIVFICKFHQLNELLNTHASNISRYLYFSIGQLPSSCLLLINQSALGFMITINITAIATVIIIFIHIVIVIIVPYIAQQTV